MGKNVYCSKIKWAVVKDSMSGEQTNQEIMEKYGIEYLIDKDMDGSATERMRYMVLINRLAYNSHNVEIVGIM